MKTAAVIAEFNPLHNGHAYFLREVRERSGADCIAVLMSGDFVQRGEPALLDKYARAEAALLCGADLVLELPVRYACANAGEFAFGAVRILDALGAVDELWFGSEYGGTGPFERAAGALVSESDSFKEHLSEGLKKGLPYPAARALAIADSGECGDFDECGNSGECGDFGECSNSDKCGRIWKNRDEALSFLEAPNNILGLEYCIALRRLGSRIKPMTLQRKGSGHNSHLISAEAGGFSSASAIRSVIRGQGLAGAADQIPPAAFSIYSRYLSENAVVLADDFSLMLKYRLMDSESRSSGADLTEYAGVSEDLALRIRNHLNSFRSFTQFADSLKARSMTRTHVNRALLHILLGIRKEDPASAARLPGFIHMLGMGSCGELLSSIKEKGSISLCSTPSVIRDGSYENDLFASNLYETVKALKSGMPFIHEFERRLLRI